VHYRITRETQLAGWHGKKAEDELQAPGGCQDKDSDCESWAKAGECTANEPYMRVYCKKACKMCE
jgi:hypothetical protein